jgi:hypothetical protein
MSHFSVLVITEEQPTDRVLAAVLQPWHEYECTGVRDQYVVSVDITDEVTEQFGEPVPIVTLSSGQVVGRYDDMLYTGKGEFGRKEFVPPANASEGELSAEDARKLGLGFATLGFATMESCAKEYFGDRITSQDGRFFRYTNPNKKWDWWQVGGRWSGKLVPKYDPEKDPANSELCAICNGTGKRTDMAVENGCNGCNGNGWRVKWPTSWARVDGDRVQVRDLQVGALRTEAEQKAAARWDAVHGVVAGREVRSFSEIKAQYGEDYQAIRDAYWGQQPIKDLLEAKVVDRFDDIDKFLVPRARFLHRARESAIVPFAVVKDGKWYERGDMGWWGVVHDEKDEDTWNAEFTKLLDGLKPETWLTVVDCHI